VTDANAPALGKTTMAIVTSCMKFMQPLTEFSPRRSAKRMTLQGFDRIIRQLEGIDIASLKLLPQHLF
jgi:hypothetical protein